LHREIGGGAEVSVRLPRCGLLDQQAVAPFAERGGQALGGGELGGHGLQLGQVGVRGAFRGSLGGGHWSSG
jgi:hypothetical protein